MNTQVRYILIINLAMFCTSTSGALGRFIDLPPPLTIWWRSIFALIFLATYIYSKKISLKLKLKDKAPIILISGVFMTCHWVTYFYALRWSNVAIAMLSLFTYPVITALLEPIILKTKFESRHILLSILVLCGIYFMIPSFDITENMTKGLIMGFVSALVYALRNIMLKTQVDSINGSALMFYQVAITIILLLPVTQYFVASKVASYIPYLMMLGLVTTAIGHTLFLNSFKHFSVSSASILGGLQPVYGILLAIIFLSEFPSLQNIIGGLLILAAVFIESRRSILT